jgi:hypothetical protein
MTGPPSPRGDGRTIRDTLNEPGLPVAPSLVTLTIAVYVAAVSPEMWGVIVIV